MGEHRQRYSEKFKEETVKFVQKQRQKKTMTDIADELQIPLSSLHEWMKHYREFENKPVVTEEDREKQLEQQLEAKDKKIAETEEELAIVKKAAHISSKPRR